jgi:hypothetical protein
VTPAGERLSDDRLAWLAVRDRLDQERYRLTWIWIVLTLAGPPVVGYFAFGSHGAYLGFGFGAIACVAVAKTLRSQRGQRMKEYGVAVDEVMRELTPPDRQHLRATGQVPPWFLDRVLAARKPL